MIQRDGHAPGTRRGPHSNPNQDPGGRWCQIHYPVQDLTHVRRVRGSLPQAHERILSSHPQRRESQPRAYTRSPGVSYVTASCSELFSNKTRLLHPALQDRAPHVRCRVCAVQAPHNRPPAWDYVWAKLKHDARCAYGRSGLRSMARPAVTSCCRLWCLSSKTSAASRYTGRPQAHNPVAQSGSASLQSLNESTSTPSSDGPSRGSWNHIFIPCSLGRTELAWRASRRALSGRDRRRSSPLGGSRCRPRRRSEIRTCRAPCACTRSQVQGAGDRPGYCSDESPQVGLVLY